MHLSQETRLHRYHAFLCNLTRMMLLSRLSLPQLCLGKVRNYQENMAFVYNGCKTGSIQDTGYSFFYLEDSLNYPDGFAMFSKQVFTMLTMSVNVFTLVDCVPLTFLHICLQISFSNGSCSVVSTGPQAYCTQSSNPLLAVGTAG